MASKLLGACWYTSTWRHLVLPLTKSRASTAWDRRA